MPLMPKRTKYRKPHRLTYDGKAKGNLELQFGEYGLQAKEGGYVSARQIEAARVASKLSHKKLLGVAETFSYINTLPHGETHSGIQALAAVGQCRICRVISSSFS